MRVSNKKFYEDNGMLRPIHCVFCHQIKHCQYHADGEPICDKCLDKPIEDFDDGRLTLAERNA
jgi:hypothetical protein